eukprot:GILI01007444.1.p1 GENE.GILI01007444.1~~GILI01007444.1.p1  ORF type:complete len:482 (-),score=107.47 GILI01007444.1:105-1550(-)
MATFEDNYILGEELGKGAYATVYRCTHRATNKPWAVKVVDKSKAGPKDISDLNHEVKVMKEIGAHPHVVQLHESFDTPANMFLILDVLEGGMLFDRVVQMKHYSERDASRLIKNFLLALEHIHSKGIMHRDLKPENLLLKKMPTSADVDASSLTDVALADFGLAGYTPGSTCCGSPSYIAPEVINVGYLRTQKDPYDGKCDVWSLGVIAYILLSGKMPFHGRNFKETFAKIIKGQWTFTGDVWESVTPSAKDFIKTMLTIDPARRPSAKDAQAHPWVLNVQPDVHLPASVESIKAFNAQQKLRGVVAVFRATTSLLGNLDRTPPFMKYLSHKDVVSTVIESKSQTDNTKLHYIDFSRALLHKTPGWKLQDCCTCGSKMVCRHLQNVHEYLFVGARAMDVAPFINELLTLQDELKADLEDTPNDRKLREKLDEVENALNAANVYHEEYTNVPADVMKPNLMLAAPIGKPIQKSTLLNAFKKK